MPKKGKAKVKAATAPAAGGSGGGKSGILKGLGGAALDAAAAGAGVANPVAGVLATALRKGLRNALGFATTEVEPVAGLGGASPIAVGGEVVRSADAPVAFSRDKGLRPFLKVARTMPNGDVVVHGLEWVRDLTPSGTANTQVLAADGINPANTNYDWLSNFAKDYVLFRFLGFKVYYTHWAPTSVQTRVAMATTPDYQALTAVPTFKQLSQFGDFACGAAYEDFELDCASTMANPANNWFYVLNNAGTEDVRLSQQGGLFVTTDQNSTGLSSIGSIYHEYVVAFAHRKSPSFSTGLANHISAHPEIPVHIACKAYGLALAKEREKPARRVDSSRRYDTAGFVRAAEGVEESSSPPPSGAAEARRQYEQLTLQLAALTPSITGRV
jgi:hypothetical protein